MRSSRTPVAILALLTVAACSGASGGGGGSSTPADASLERLSAACTEYRRFVFGRYPPASPDGYPGYLRDRSRAVDRLAAAARRERTMERNRAARGALLAGASGIQSQLTYSFREGEPQLPATEVVLGLYSYGDFLNAAEQRLDQLARRDAGALVIRAEALARLPELAGADELGRRTVALEARLAEAALRSTSPRRLRARDAPYVALATSVQELWRRQGAEICSKVYG